MAHNLTITNGKAEMFSGQNIVPWHGLGTVVAGLLTAKEAIQEARLNWNVKTQPVEHNGKMLPDYFKIVREDTDTVLSILGKRYTPIQNIEAFEFFDSVVGEGQAVYDTAGSLNQGKKVWIMAKLKGSLFIDSNPTDTIDKNVLLSTSHDGTSSLSMMIVGTRVVCQNTLSVALNGAINRINIRHTKNYVNKKDDAMKVLGLCNGYFDELQTVINALAKTPMNKGDMVTFTEKLVPTPENLDESTRTLNIRNTIVSLFDRGMGNKGKSRWDALNAVTEYVDHNRSTRSNEANKDESRFSSAMLGSGYNLKDKAFNLLTA